MRRYNKALKVNSRSLRSSMTDAEQLLWSRLRRKQILNVQFYRQKPLGNFIVDFYSSKVSLVIEVDGAQHMDPDNRERDRVRSQYLRLCGLEILRFNNLQVLREIEAVMSQIYTVIEERLPE